MMKVFAALCLLGTSVADNVPSPSMTAMSPSPSPGRKLQASTTLAPAPTGPSDAEIAGASVGAVGAAMGIGLAVGLEDHEKLAALHTGGCVINGARAVDDMLDSAIFIMASLKRCEGADAIRCEVDVASAIESVNKMINVILHAVKDCGGFADEHEQCGLAVSELTRSMAGLAAASGGIVAKCPNQFNGGHALATVGSSVLGDGSGFSNGLGQCMVDIKDSVKSLFKAIKRIMTTKEHCEDPKSEECSHNALKIVAAFAGLAEYIAGSVAQCSSDPKIKADDLCVQMSIRLFQAVANVNRAAGAMSVGCKLTEAERLYLDNEKMTATASGSNSPMTFVLAALLPITAVLGFIGGKRLARSHSRVTDCESGLE